MIRETARIIDQTAPHQLVVAKVLGALNCTDLLRVIKTEGAHPFVATTDGMADMRGAADLVVSFDGGFKYGLAIEVKTTTQTDASAGPFKLFKAVKSIERNQRQFDRLINTTPAWWYIVVHIGKLTAKTVSEMDRALLDCPAVIVEGQHADATPDELLGVKPLGELLDIVSDRLKLLGAPAPLPSPQVQLDMLAHVEDVPVVTLDTPLKAPVWSVPLSVVKPDRVLDDLDVPDSISEPHASLAAVDARRLEAWSLSTAYAALIREWDAVGDEQMTRRINPYAGLLKAYVRFKDEPDDRTRSRLTKTLYKEVCKTGMHNAIYLCLALMATRSGRDGGRISSSFLKTLFPEGLYRVGTGNEVRHLMPMVGRYIYPL